VSPPRHFRPLNVRPIERVQPDLRLAAAAVVSSRARIDKNDDRYIHVRVVHSLYQKFPERGDENSAGGATRPWNLGH